MKVGARCTAAAITVLRRPTEGNPRRLCNCQPWRRAIDSPSPCQGSTGSAVADLLRRPLLSNVRGRLPFTVSNAANSRLYFDALQLDQGNRLVEKFIEVSIFAVNATEVNRKRQYDAL